MQDEFTKVSDLFREYIDPARKAAKRRGVKVKWRRNGKKWYLKIRGYESSFSLEGCNHLDNKFILEQILELRNRIYHHINEEAPVIWGKKKKRIIL